MRTQHRRSPLSAQLRYAGANLTIPSDTLKSQQSRCTAAVPVPQCVYCAVDTRVPCMQAPSSSQGDNGDYSGLASLQDLPEYPRAFVIRRLFVFLGIVVGCACGTPRHRVAAVCAGFGSGARLCFLGIE